MQSKAGNPEIHATARLPARVVRAIEIQRQRGEILVSWIQAGLVGLLTTLYIVAPSTAPMDAALKPVPWALGIYAAFTLFRLDRAYRRRMTVALSIVSVFVDVGVLIFTIWSFHIQYGQPAAFYLKAPTFAYLFIFIAMRMLSFRPGYVALAGITAALGWLGLLGYALAAPGGADLITRDYVSYMTSARILVGAEIDKVISILVVTGLLALGAARGRQMLEQSLAEQAIAGQFARFFSPDIAETLTRADELLRPGEGQSREATAMFVDLRGFTRMAAELEPNALIELLGEYQGIVVAVVHRHSGSITTFLGDGVMVTFGAIRTNPASAADALRCADDLVSELQSWSERRRANGGSALGIGIGVEYGLVTCGAIGGGGRLEYAVIGDPVNRAAKLQNHTKVEKVRSLTTAETLERAKAQGYVPPVRVGLHRGRIVAGISTPVNIAILSG